MLAAGPSLAILINETTCPIFNDSRPEEILSQIEKILSMYYINESSLQIKAHSKSKLKLTPNESSLQSPNKSSLQMKAHSK